MFSFFKNKPKATFTPEYQSYLTFFNKKADLRLPIREARFIVLDTETTGLDFKTDSILSIAAVEVRGFGFLAKNRMECFLKQSIYQPRDSIAVHGISQRKTEEGMEKTEALAKLLAFVKNDIIVGHHIGFDVAILNEELKRSMGGPLKNRVLDTSVLAKRIDDPFQLKYLNRKEYTLDALCKRFGIEMGQRHTAAGDVFITALLFLKLLGRLEQNGVGTLKELLK